MDDVTQIILAELKEIKETTTKTLVQAEKTNGRVTTLEKAVASLESIKHDPKNCPSNNKLLWKTFFLIIGSGAAIVSITIAVIKLVFRI